MIKKRKASRKWIWITIILLIIIFVGIVFVNWYVIIDKSASQSSIYCQTDDDCIYLLGCECGCYNKDYKPKEQPFYMTCTCKGFFENIECICENNKCTPKQ